VTTELLDEPLIQLVTAARPFSFDTTAMEVGRATIEDLITIAGIPPGTPMRVYVDGVLHYPEFYHVTRPKAGAHVLIRVVPRGGGGGQGKNIGQLVLGLVLIVAGTFLSISTWGWGTTIGVPMISMGVGLALSSVINMLIPPPAKPKLRPLSSGSADQESPTLSITGQRNDLRPYGVVPRIFGTHRIFPPFAAAPFTEIVGADQYLRLLFLIGLGETTSTEHKIGETPIDNFEGVEMEVRTGAPGESPITLYTNDVNELPLSDALTQAGGAVIRTTTTETAEISISNAFPGGLVQFDPNTGEKFYQTVSIDVEYRLVGQTAWVAAPSTPLVSSEARQAMVRSGLRWKPQRPAGPYVAASWSHLGLASVTLSRLNDGVLNVIAFDADSAGVGAWLELDAGSVVEFGRVLITSAGGVTNAIWDVQGSDDRVTWTTYKTGFATGANTIQAAEWPAARARYWRLLKTNGATAGPDYYEVEWWQTTPGQYDVRQTRTTPDSVSQNVIDAVIWTALRSFRLGSPVNLPPGLPVALTAMRIKATDQLNGVLDSYNCIATSRMLDYATYAGNVQADKPLGYWRLGEANGSPTAFDASGNGRSGSYAGNPGLGVAGLVTDDTDTAMLCDGSDDTVTVALVSTIDMGNMSFTIECAIRPESIAAGTRGIVHKGDGLEFTNDHLGWALRRSAAKLQFVRASGSGAPTVLESNANLVVGTVYHVVVQYDKATGLAILWINGVVDNTVNLGTAPYADTYQLQISYPVSGGAVWDGFLDEVAVYPSQLTNVRVAAHAAAFTGTREWIVAETSNPASHYRRILQGPENARPLADERLDLVDLQTWHMENSSGGRSCNLVVDYETGVYDLLKTVALCGRATPTMNDDRYSTVRDVAQSVPRQHFTPRNSRRWRGHRTFVDPVHALKVPFIDRSTWQQSERIVYADGYSEAGEVAGTVAATRLEVLDLHGCTDPDMAWRYGRYILAVAQLRPEVHEFETDVEYLVARRGNRIEVAHDVLEHGLTWGRIRSVATSGPNATAITLDEVCPMQANLNYAVRMRLNDGTSVVAPVQTVEGEQKTVTFITPVVPPIPAVGDLVLFGLLGLESRSMLVSRIAPAPDLSATLTVVDLAPAVLMADQGSIPPWDPQMTKPQFFQQLPPTPLIDNIVSDETVLLRDLDGSLHARVVITLHYLPTSNVRADAVEARWRLTGSGVPFDSLATLPADSTTISITALEEGQTYDFRIRTVTRDGLTSPWAEINAYTVVGKSTPPAPPTNLRLDGPQTLRWDFLNSPPDFAGFEVRRNPGTVANWQTALEMHVGLVFSPFALPVMYGQWTFLVAAIDTSGNASSPAQLTVNFGDVRLHNQVATKDYDADGYPGSITNGSVSAGDLKADQLTTGFWTADGNLFWSASGATLFWQGTYKEMTYLFTYTTGANAGGTTLFFDTTVVAVAWSLEYRVGSSGDYLPWPGALANILPSQEYDFRLITAAGTVQGIVSRLTLYLDAEDITEHQAGFATAVTTGTRLTLLNTYRSIKQVKPTVVASGGETAITAIAADKQNTAGAGNGPLIKSYDAAGAVVAGHVDVDVVGY
jgi:hypothetical protein